MHTHSQQIHQMTNEQTTFRYRRKHNEKKRFSRLRDYVRDSEKEQEWIEEEDLLLCNSNFAGGMFGQ